MTKYLSNRPNYDANNMTGFGGYKFTLRLFTVIKYTSDKFNVLSIQTDFAGLGLNLYSDRPNLYIINRYQLLNL